MRVAAVQLEVAVGDVRRNLEECERLARDADGEVRNAYLLAAPTGEILGRHDKDLPTMWENAFYVGGSDDGVIEAAGFTAGAAVCWEFMRTATARRLRGRVDL